jgi:LuxR family maltose regulon positive regulatory protein
VTEALERGNEALAAGAWAEARGCFEEALASSDAAELWEGLSWAAWWLEDGARSIEAREQAYRRFKQRGDLRGAGRMAIWLAMDHVEFRNEYAVAQGWFARCERILAELPPSPEHGWLAAFQAAFALDEGDSVTAGQLGTGARDLGRELGVLALEMLGLATEGIALVTRGEVAQGMRCLDEASAAAMGGEYEENFPICWTCCYLIYACEQVRDFDRAVQWCRKVEQYAERRGIKWVHRVCRAHYAAVLTWHGDWEQAEHELLETRRTIAATRPAWTPEVSVRLADLRRRQGRLVEAEALLAECGPIPDAVLCAAELALDRGDHASAIEAAERLLRQLPAENRTQRAGALEALVRAHAAAGDATAAHAPLGELRSIAATIASGPLRAALRLCEGVMEAAAGDHGAARASLEDAVALFHTAQAPYEAARARLVLAASLAALGEEEPARREAETARAVLDGLGAERESARAAALLERIGVANGRLAGPLSARELEVLRLVADGRTDREIAAELVLSHHTVHRHVSNIYVKLDCSTRAAAVAKAGRLELL